MNSHRQTISEEYLMGISEGRHLLMTNNPDLQDMRAFLNSCEATMKEFGPGPVKDMLKGERDFWRLQISKKIARGGDNHDASKKGKIVKRVFR